MMSRGDLYWLDWAKCWCCFNVAFQKNVRSSSPFRSLSPDGHELLHHLRSSDAQDLCADRQQSFLRVLGYHLAGSASQETSVSSPFPPLLSLPPLHHLELELKLTLPPSFLAVFSRHFSFRDDEIAATTGLTVKELGKVAGPLFGDRLIKT